MKSNLEIYLEQLAKERDAREHRQQIRETVFLIATYLGLAGCAAMLVCSMFGITPW